MKNTLLVAIFLAFSSSVCFAQIDWQVESDYLIPVITVADINVNDADADASNEIQNLDEVLQQANDANAQQIKNLAAPTENSDAATKLYVDNVSVDKWAYHQSGRVSSVMDGNLNAFVNAPDFTVTAYDNLDTLQKVIVNINAVSNEAITVNLYKNYATANPTDATAFIAAEAANLVATGTIAAGLTFTELDFDDVMNTSDKYLMTVSVGTVETTAATGLSIQLVKKIAQ